MSHVFSHQIDPTVVISCLLYLVLLHSGRVGRHRSALRERPAVFPVPPPAASQRGRGEPETQLQEQHLQTPEVKALTRTHMQNMLTWHKHEVIRKCNTIGHFLGWNKILWYIIHVCLGASLTQLLRRRVEQEKRPLQVCKTQFQISFCCGYVLLTLNCNRTNLCGTFIDRCLY